MNKPHQWLNQICVAVAAYSPEGQLIGTWGATYPVFYEFDEYDRMSAMHTLRDTNVVVDSYSSFSSQPSAFDKTTWLYDEGTGLLTNKLYADGKGTAYSYTPDGKLASRIWARGIVTTYSYTNTGEMVSIDYSDSTPDVAFTYDRLGRQVTITDAQGARTFSYDPSTLALTNETIVAGGVTSVLARTQDSFGRVSGFTLGDDYSVSYGFAADGRFDSVDSVVLGVTNNWQYSYLSGSDLISGVSNSVASVRFHEYETHRDFITSVQNTAGTNLISRFEYANDPIGQRTQRIDTSSSTVTNDFLYNTRSELISAAMGENTFSWTLDNIGNRKSAFRNGTNRVFETNELNQYASISNGGLRELSYDLDGNLTNDSVFAHTFNGENRLIMSVPVAVTNGSKRVQNAYDYRGRRFRKVVETWDGSSWASATTNIFIYDGFNLIYEQDGTGGAIRSYVRGLDLSGSLQGAGGTGGLLAMISGNNTYFYLGDANGNVTELVDTNGEIVVHYEWDAYGNRLNASGGNEPENPFGFSGQYRDKETGLDMYIFRPYSPELERFVQRDPVGEQGFKRQHADALFSNSQPVRDLIRVVNLDRMSLNGRLYLFLDNVPINSCDYLGLANPVCNMDKPNKRCFWTIEGCDMKHGIATRCCKLHEACHILQYKKLVSEGKCPACEYNPTNCRCDATYFDPLDPLTFRDGGRMSVERDCQVVKNRDMECPCYWIHLKCLLDGASKEGVDSNIEYWIEVVWGLMWRDNCFAEDKFWVDPL